MQREFVMGLPATEERTDPGRAANDIVSHGGFRTFRTVMDRGDQLQLALLVNGGSIVGFREVMRVTGMSKSTANRAIEDGMKDGWLVSSGGRGRPAVYTVIEVGPTSGPEDKLPSDTKLDPSSGIAPSSLLTTHREEDHETKPVSSHPEVVIVYASHHGPRGVIERLSQVEDRVIVEVAREWITEVRNHKHLAGYVKHFDANGHLSWRQRENAIQILSERGQTVEQILNAAAIGVAQ